MAVSTTPGLKMILAGGRRRPDLSDAVNRTLRGGKVHEQGGHLDLPGSDAPRYHVEGTRRVKHQAPTPEKASRAVGERRKLTSKDEPRQPLPDEDLIGSKEQRTNRVPCSPS